MHACSSKNYSYILFPERLRQNGNTLFVSEEIMRIHHGFNFHQSVKITVKILSSINSSFPITVLSVTVNSQFDVSIVQKRLS